MSEPFDTPMHLLLDKKWLASICKKCGIRQGLHPLHSDECPTVEDFEVKD